MFLLVLQRVSIVFNRLKIYSLNRKAHTELQSLKCASAGHIHQDCLDKTKRNGEGERFRRGGSWKRMDSLEEERGKEGEGRADNYIWKLFGTREGGKELIEKIESQGEPEISN